MQETELLIFPHAIQGREGTKKKTERKSENSIWMWILEAEIRESEQISFFLTCPVSQSELPEVSVCLPAALTRIQHRATIIISC